MQGLRISIHAREVSNVHSSVVAALGKICFLFQFIFPLLQEKSYIFASPRSEPKPKAYRNMPFDQLTGRGIMLSRF